MLRLLVVGSGAVLDDLADSDLLRRWGIEVVAQVPPAADVSGREADVLLIGENVDAHEFLSALSEHHVPGVVVLSRDRRVVADIRAAGAHGWALLPPETTDATLAAAIVAAASGFAVEAAVSGGPDVDVDDYGEAEPLTARERDVLELVSRGYPNRTIALRLGISEHTVKFHLSSIFGKLGVSSRTEAVRRGVRAGLIQI